jgi:hypothetical protein
MTQLVPLQPEKNTKLQISNKSQIPNDKLQTFGSWSLKFVCYLVLGFWCLLDGVVGVESRFTNHASSLMHPEN